MLSLLYAALFVLTGCAGYSFSQRKSGAVKGWQMKNGDTLVPLSTPDTIQLATIFFSIFLKYVPFTKGYAASLKVNGAEDGFDLPVVNLHGPVILNELDMETFNTAVSRRFSKSSKQDDTLNPFFFTSICTPVLLHTLASHACPIKPLGSVNTGNTFRFRDATFCRDAKAILKASQDRQLTYTSRFGGKEMSGQRKKRGVETSITVEVKREEEVVFEMTFGLLQFLPRKHLPLYKDDRQEKESNSNKAEETSSSVRTPLFMSLRHPNKWAASCCDYNPIHISPLAAKFFGFSSTIAHGNHVVALAIQDALEDDQKNDSDVKGIIEGKQFSLQVRFVKPVLLPADLKVKWQGQGEKIITLEVNNKEDKTCVAGELKASC